MGRYVLGFHEVDRADLPLVGGERDELGRIVQNGRHSSASWLLCNHKGI